MHINILYNKKLIILYLYKYHNIINMSEITDDFIFVAKVMSGSVWAGFKDFNLFEFQFLIKA